MAVSIFVSLLAAGLAAAQSTFSPARLPAVPLAVKSPYLSTWLFAGSDGGNGGYLPGQWPTFWAGQVTGWTGLIRVDGTAYTWMGAPLGPSAATQVAFEYTSSKSIFTLHVADKLAMNVTFLSPITPDDQRRQSVVCSYMSVEVQSMDGASHDVQLYSDISAEWVSGDPSSVAQWDYGAANGVAYHHVWKQGQMAFSEANDQAEFGDWYYATDAARGLTYQSGADVDVRGKFVSDGTLANANDSDFRAINSRWPVFGFAVALGQVGASAASTLFTIGLAQPDAVQYVGSNGPTTLPSLWKSYWDTGVDAVSHFHTDYSEFNRLSTATDDKIASDAIGAAGQNYLTATSLAVRQAFGATQLAGTNDNAYLFLKEISSDGNVQTVDVVFPAMPIFLYLRPQLLQLLLKPLFENQEAGQWPNAYAMHDLGLRYPNATGHPDGNAERMPLEECGDMVIMALAYAQRAQDNGFLSQHYDILKRWTGYLVQDALYPANQMSTDDFAGALANQTNLALKGIIGIQAMSDIATRTGHGDDAANFSDIAHSYISQWVTLGTNADADPPHTTLAYGNASSYGLLYNLYADALVQTGLVPGGVYAQQSAFYATAQLRYGVPLDSRHTYTKSDWEMFAAAVAGRGTRDALVAGLAAWIGSTPTNRPYTDLFYADSGDYPYPVVFAARPVMGGAFALLAL